MSVKKIFQKDKNCIYVWCNENYAKDFKLNSKDMVGKSDYDLYPKKLADKYCDDDKRIMKSKNTEDIEEDYVVDGKKSWVHTIKTPVLGKNGKAEGVLGVFWDTTEEKNKEKALRKSKEELRAILDQSFQLIGILSLEGKLLFANKAAFSMVEKGESELIGKYFWMLPWWTHSKKLQNEVKEGVKKSAKGEFVRFEATHKDKKGVLHYIDFSINPAKNKKGEIIYLIPEGRDITDRKLAETKLKQKMEQLERVNKLMVGRELKMIELKKQISAKGGQKKQNG